MGYSEKPRLQPPTHLLRGSAVGQVLCGSPTKSRLAIGTKSFDDDTAVVESRLVRVRSLLGAQTQNWGNIRRFPACVGHFAARRRPTSPWAHTALRIRPGFRATDLRTSGSFSRPVDSGRPKLARSRSKLARNRTSLARNQPDSSEGGQEWTKAGPTSAQLGPTSAKLLQKSSKVGRNIGQIWGHIAAFTKGA